MLGKHATGLIINSENGLLAVDPEDTSVGLELSRNGVFAKSTLDELLALIGPDNHVLVAGAHVGALAIPFAKKAAKVVAFEANPNTFQLLKLNRTLNHADNLELHPLALGSQAGTLSFLLNRVNSGGSKRVPKTAHAMYYSDKPDVVQVNMVAADELLPDDTFDLILMDIEGSESEALKGMPRILSRCKHLFIEYLPHHIDLVAGITDEEFAALLAPHFSTAKYHQEKLEAPTSQLHAFLKTIRSSGGGDILLSK